MKVDSMALALAVGILWGVIVFLGTLAVAWWGFGQDFFQVWTSVYPGYTLTLGGSILGLIYGFIDGFIGGWLLGWLYNMFAAKK